MCRLTSSVSLVVLSAALAAVAPAIAAPGDLIAMIPARFTAPHGLAYDEDDGTFWVSSVLEEEIVHYSADLTERLGDVPVPYDSLVFSFANGLAFNSRAHTLLVVDGFDSKIHELRKDGSPTGRVFDIPYQTNHQSPGALLYWAEGDDGPESLFLVENGDGLIYQMTLDGEFLRMFPDLEDPDRYFGIGNLAHPFGMSLEVEDGELTGFWVASTTAGLIELDLDGNFTGRWAPLDAAGGSVGSLLRRPFPDPRTGAMRDSFICVVPTEARFAILEVGFTEFSEVTRFNCSQSDRDLNLDWSIWKTFDSIDVLRDCEVVDTLPGTATTWSGRVDDDGVFEYSVRARDGWKTSSSVSCTVVTGPGRVLDELEPENGLGIFDIAWDGDSSLLVSDSKLQEIRVMDLDLQAIRTAAVSDFFAPEGDFVGALAVDPSTRTIFILNHTANRIGKLDLDTFVFLDSFDLVLPHLGGPDRERPSIAGMTFRPGTTPGSGTLLVVDVRYDVIYEVSQAGVVVDEIPHPHVALEELPDDLRFGPNTSGVSMVSDGGRDRVLLSGGLYREGTQQRIFEFDLETREVIPGTELPTAAMRGSGFGLAHVGGPGAPRLFTTSTRHMIYEIVPTQAAVSPPSFFTCDQTSGGDDEDGDHDVLLTFTLNGAYDEIEVARDCEAIASIDGAATRFVDTTAAPGIHDYAVRARAGGAWSPSVDCRLRVGSGAVLSQSYMWPVVNPRHLTRDPVIGDVFISGKLFDDEGKLGEELVHRFMPPPEGEGTYLFDRTLDPPLDSSIEINTFAMRRPPDGERLIYFVLSDLESTTLLAKTVDGEFIEQAALEPPLPEPPFPSAPTGLCWNPDTDTFFYLERNSATFVEIDPSGVALRTFPHPAPPPNHFFSNVGVAFSRERESLFAPTIARPSDLDVGFTRLVEIDLDGRLTGLDMPINPRLGFEGMTMIGKNLLLVSTSPFDEFRTLLAVAERHVASAPFIRGDTNGSGRVELSDPIFVLNFLFRAGEDPGCEDAADANDDGGINITDAVAVLGHLFLAGPPPAEPFPDAGLDPTDDALSCGE